MANLDELCPPYVGEARLALALRTGETGSEIPRAGQVVDVTVSYADTIDSGGVMLPLDLHVASPDGRDQRRVYRRLVPSIVSFVPRAPGRHVVTLRERHHNRWVGTLVIDVLDFAR